MTASTGLATAIAVALLSVAYTAPALAEAGPSYSPGPAASTSLDSDKWSYSTYYLYPLTRHMDESEITGGWRYALYPLTVVLDTVQLPWGALAGLFGD